MQVFIYLRSERSSFYVKFFKKSFRDDDDDVHIFFSYLILIYISNDIMIIIYVNDLIFTKFDFAIIF
jgi:hypothetical protein